MALSDKVKTYEIDVDKLNIIFNKDPQVLHHYIQFSNLKIVSLINRLNNIKSTLAELFEQDYEVLKNEKLQHTNHGVRDLMYRKLNENNKMVRNKVYPPQIDLEKSKTIATSPLGAKSFLNTMKRNNTENKEFFKKITQTAIKPFFNRSMIYEENLKMKIISKSRNKNNPEPNLMKIISESKRSFTKDLTTKENEIERSKISEFMSPFKKMSIFNKNNRIPIKIIYSKYSKPVKSTNFDTFKTERKINLFKLNPLKTFTSSDTYSPIRTQEEKMHFTYKNVYHETEGSLDKYNHKKNQFSVEFL